MHQECIKLTADFFKINVYIYIKFSFSTKILNGTNIFKFEYLRIWEFEKCYLSTKFSILEGFQKDRMTLNTVIITAKIQFCHYRNKLYFKIYQSKTVIMFVNITICTIFFFIKILADLESINNLYKKQNQIFVHFYSCWPHFYPNSLYKKGKLKIND